jgi:hypothetical protein
MVGTVIEALRHIKAELAALLDAPAILALCHEVGYHWRARLLAPVTTVHLFILHILHGNTACRHLPHLVAHHFTASAFCQARIRLPLGVWQRLLRRTAAVCEQTTHDEGRWRGHRTFVRDGSSFSMPETPELQESFGQPSGQRPGCGFPVAHLLALFHAGTGFLLETLAATWHTHDMAEVATLHAALRGEQPAGMAPRTAAATLPLMVERPDPILRVSEHWPCGVWKPRAGCVIVRKILTSTRGGEVHATSTFE